MKVLLINGQNHKGSTYHIGRILAEKLTLPAEIDEIFLPRDMPHFCCGCSRCFMEGESLCPHYETTKPLTERMDEADVLIFTSPVLGQMYPRVSTISNSPFAAICGTDSRIFPVQNRKIFRHRRLPVRTGR